MMISKWKMYTVSVAALLLISVQAIAGSYNKKIKLDDKNIPHLMKIIDDPAYARKKVSSKISHAYKEEYRRTPRHMRASLKERIAINVVKREVRKSVIKLSHVRYRERYYGKEWQKAKNQVIDLYIRQLNNDSLDKKILNQVALSLALFRAEKARILPILLKGYHDGRVAPQAVIKMAGKNDREVVPIVLEMLPRARRKAVPLAVLVRIGDTSPEVMTAINRIEDHALSSYAVWRLTGNRQPMLDSVADEIKQQLLLAKQGKNKKLSKQTMVNFFWLGEEGRALAPYLVSMASGKDGWCHDRSLDESSTASGNIAQYKKALNAKDAMECRANALIVLWKLDIGNRKSIEAFYEKTGVWTPAVVQAFMLSGKEANAMIPVLNRMYQTGGAHLIKRDGRRTRSLNLGIKRELAIALQALTGKHYPEAPDLTPNWKQAYMEHLRDKNWSLHWLPF